jgi:hypothetical protein
VDGQIVNSHVIETTGDGAAGVVMIGDRHHLTNSGRITTDGGTFDGATVGIPVGELRAAGVLVTGDDALVVNTKKGVIESKNASSAAVELNVLEQEPATAMSSTLENFGLIKGASVAVLGGVGEEHVINHGRIVGDVDLGAGDDEFVAGKGGILDGDLFLGGGEDLVRIEDGSGTTQIVDFVSGVDSIDVSAIFSDPADLEAAVSDTGDDLVIALDQNDQLVLVGVPDFNAADFGLV